MDYLTSARAFLLSLAVLWIAQAVLPVVAQPSEVFYSIKEELSPGTIFGYIVDDSDLKRKVSPDDLGNLRYSFLTTGNLYSKYFSIQPKSAILSVASRIDRETVCSFRADCQLTLNAVVQSELGPFFHLITVHVEVTDINDNPPTFSQSTFPIVVPENALLGNTFALPTAFDKDTGDNNTDSSYYPFMVQDYFLMNGDGVFALSTTKDDGGNIQTALQLLRALNREETETMTVLVGARDGGKPPLTGTLTVRVTVSDINDNYPVFDSYQYNVNVSETTRTSDPVLKITATDADAGPNGNLTFSFSKLQPQEVLELFRMDSASGTMYITRSMENHTGNIYELVVEASDQGQPPKVSRAIVRVRVLDTVNSRPDIVVDILRSSTATADGQAEVSEYAEVGKVVAYVSVRDPDSGQNGVTVCRLNTKHFDLQPLNNHGQYKVILVSNLDRERIARYQISVGCQDFGFPPLENSKAFQINVKDENDNAPQFSQTSYHTTIRENQTAGAVITQLTVTDADEGRNADVEFRVAGAHRHEFSIFQNGTMIATTALDREASEKLVVKVVAVDKGYPPLSGTAVVHIILEDVNDMAPRFSDPGYSFSVSEDVRVGAFVGIVAATDDDHGRNAQVSFRTTPGEPRDGGPFVITEDGVVKTNRPLDREKNELHYLTVIARDGGDPSLSSTTTVTIHIDDVNDNVPYFVYPSEANDSMSIPHTYPVRTAITQIRATDLDAGQNSALVYSCASSNDSFLFGVDSKSGDLYLNRIVSRGQVGLYILRVAAHDEGVPQLSNQTLLFVDVYFDNSTLLDAAHGAEPTKAVLTALILVGVVIVAGAAAIITLLCVRRQEVKKKQEAAAVVAGVPATTPTKSQGGYYIAPGVCESPAFGGNGMANGIGLNKPVPEQSVDGGGAGRPTDVGLRSANPYVIMPPHSPYNDAEGPPEIIEISRNGLFHRAEDPYPGDDTDRTDDSRFSTFRSQNGTLGDTFRHNSLQRSRYSAEELDDVKRLDDTLSLSELSYQSTSDSGRGGSEFDVANAGHKEKGAMQTCSPQHLKAGHGHGQHPEGSSSYRPRDTEVSFSTFRGESPCSFRFGGDSDSDTLTKGHRHPSFNTSSLASNGGSSNATVRASPVPSRVSSHPARSLQSVPGTTAPSTVVFRPPPPGYNAGDIAAEEGGLGRRSGPSGGAGSGRRAVPPSADLPPRHGYPLFQRASTPSSHERFASDRAGPYTDAAYPPERRACPPPGSAPHVEFRGRNNLGVDSASRRATVPDYVNAYSDLDSGDDSRYGGDLEPGEGDYLLPPYPPLLEGEEELVDGEVDRDVSERSALNFVPGITPNLSRTSEDSFRARRSSRV